ncbi:MULTISPECIES: acyl-CoA dehydrogenase family protein [Brevibacillus]|uniref:acyl-CoA dehydrogenase family protein n=1 Tax=Brevibacillus TaxID=55080 RepID=UPI000EE6DAA5|nr:acyl-CoA dehydrogenase family protein [Brevibacillus sp.]HBZ81588.1 acyl-CoA dehydrogenase [Brevibacillus sp.]
METAELRWYQDGFTPEDFTEEDQLIAKTTELFVKQDVAPKMTAIEQHDYAAGSKLFGKAGELGLLGIEVPEQYGGLSLNKKVAGLVAEKMGFAGSFSVSFNIHAGVGTLPYVYFGTEEQKQSYLPKLAAGEWIGAYALTESNAGSDALHARTSAVLNEDGTGWILNGEKQWITNAQLANVYVVFANTSEGMTAFIVERTYPGVSVGPEEKKMGIKGSSTATLLLEDVHVPQANVLGKPGQGHRVALNILNMARLKLAFSNIGSAKQALQLAVTYGKVRKQFQKSLVDFTMIQEKIANMAVSIYGAESAAYRTAGALDDALQAVSDSEDMLKKLADFAMECAINKVYGSEVQDQAVDEAVQIHGGYGYMQEYEVERLYRDARISRIFEGTNEINRLTIGKILMKKYAGNPESLPLSPVIAGGEAGRNERFVAFARRLCQQSLYTIGHSALQVDQEQEYLRLLADIVKDLYVMESALLRTQKAIRTNGPGKEAIKQAVADVLCEEGYRRVEEAAISLVSGAETDAQKRAEILQQIRNLPVPLYENLFVKKRAIAKEITNRARYFV